MPAVVETWGLWDQNIPIQRIREPGYVFGVGWKWHHQKQTNWIDVTHPDPAMFPQTVREILDQADIVVTYNGDKFDLPKLNAVLLSAGLDPPSSFKSVDLYKTVKRLGLESAKLDYALQYFGLGAKIHTDYSLWQGCMAGDKRAIKQMATYCKGDVEGTEVLHDFLLPWIKNYPNIGLWVEGGQVCTRCGSKNVQKRGTQMALNMRYQRWSCGDCGSWSRSAVGERIDATLRTVS